MRQYLASLRERFDRSRRPDLHPSWTAVSWPDEVRPVPLDDDLQPIDPALLTPEGRAGAAALVVAPGRSALHPDIVDLVRPALDERPDVGIFYGDDAVAAVDGGVSAVHCKPSLNEALMLADDYIGFPLVIRPSALSQVDLLFGLPARDAVWYRFCLTVLAAGVGIDRIPHTLIASPGRRPEARREARAEVLARWFEETGQPLAVQAGRTPDTLRLVRRFDDPPEVTLVIPTRQGAPPLPSGTKGRPHVADLLDSIARSSYPQDRLKVLVGDDHADDALFRGRNDRFALRRIVTTPPAGTPFNYAAKMNRLWRAADTELMILLNDDVVARTPDWIEALMTFAVDGSVGGVGARLLYPDGRIQHAGMFGGIYGVCAHPWYLEDADAPTYEDWALTQRDCSVVTGAVFATRRAAMEAVNGFDETFSLDFNDVDLCLKMRMLGYRIVYTPFAELTHFEKGSRGVAVAPGAQVMRYMRRWADFLADDPMYSPQLRIDTDRVEPLDRASAWVTADTFR